MTTILIFPFDLLSHYLRCLVLADTYDKSTHRIIFLTSERYSQYVHQHGYQTFSCKQFDSAYVMKCAGNFDFSWLNYEDLEEVMLDQVSAIQSFRADIVIGDMAPTLRMSAEYCKVTYLSLMNGYMTRHYASTRKIPSTHKASKLFSILPESISDLLTDFAEKRTFIKMHEPFARIRAKYQLQPILDYLSEMEGDQNLICDLPDLFPQKQLPVNYTFTGPLIYNYQQEEEEWLSQLNKERPVIVVTMGSSGEWTHLSFLNSPYYSKYIIITAGDNAHVLFAPHIIPKRFVNLSAVLQKADLMICHGGNGTIYSGISNKVFMLCLSSHFEQEWNIAALEKNGYGKSARNFDETLWKKHISEALEPAFEHA